MSNEENIRPRREHSPERRDEVSQIHLPDTALHSAQSFFLNRGKDVFIADAPFRLEPEGPRYSVGHSMSRLLVASSPKYSEARDEFGEHGLSKEQAIENLKTALAGMYQYAHKRARKEPSPQDVEAFKASFIDRIDESLIDEALKEARRRYPANKKAEAEALKRPVENVERGYIPGMDVPPSPDELALMQKSFTEAIFDKLRLEDGTDIGTFISKATDGRIKHVLATGLWRDRNIENAVSATDESVDVSSKRNSVESFLTNLPAIAADAIAKRDDLSPEQKERIMLGAEILYARADKLRHDRLQTIDRRSVATESASLNQRAANAYGTLFKFKILPPLREELEITERKGHEGKSAYEKRIRAAVQEKNRQNWEAMQAFTEVRKPIVAEHLLAFMDRLETGGPLGGIFPGTLGSVLSSTGEAGKKLYLDLKARILARPEGSRFKTDRPETPRISDTRPYVVYDEATGKLMEPPARMIEALEASYKTLNADITTLDRVGEQIRNAQYEILSTDIADLITLAKRLDVLEADLHIPDIKVHMHAAREAMTTGVSRGEPGSLKWRATSHMDVQISGMQFRINEAEMLLMNTRKTLILKFIDQVREQMNAAPQGTDFGQLPAALAEYELLAQRSKADTAQLRSAINFFVAE